MKQQINAIILSFIVFLGDQVQAIEAQLRIGVIRPKSGLATQLGEDLWQGVQLAFSIHLKKDPKLKSKISIIDGDDQGSPSQAAKVTQELIQQKRVHALIGSVSNLLNQEIADTAIRFNRFTILPYATDESTYPEGSPIFSTSLSEKEQGEVLGKFAYRTLQKKRAFILAPEHDPYAEGISEGFRSSFNESGGNILGLVYYPPIYEKSDVFTDQPNGLDAADIILIPGYFQDAVKLLSQLQESSQSKIYLGSDSWEDPRLASLLGSPAPTSYFFSTFNKLNPDPNIQTFLRSFRQKYMTDPNAISYFGFAAADMLISTYLAANSNRTESLKIQITKPEKIKSLLGPFQLSSRGSILRPVTFMEVQSNAIKFMQNFNHLNSNKL